MGFAADDNAEATARSTKHDIFDDTPVHEKAPTPAPTPGYKSYENQGMNKYEMLEVVDKHLATMTTTMSQLDERIGKLEEILKKLPSEVDQIKNTEIPTIKKQLSVSIYSAPLPGSGTGTGAGATLGKVLEGVGDGDLKTIKTKVDEMSTTALPNLQTEVAILKDSLRNLEAIVGTMETVKLKDKPGIVIEQDPKKKAP